MPLSSVPLELELAVAFLTCYQPEAAGFFSEHGIDIYTEPMGWQFVEDSGIVRSVDPLRLEVVLTTGETNRTFVVDDECRVIQE